MKHEDNIYRHKFCIKQGELLLKASKGVMVDGKPLNMDSTKEWLRRLKESLAKLEEMGNP